MNFKRFSVVHSDHGVSRKLIADGLRRIESDHQKGQHVIEFNRFIGFSNLVEVSENDKFYEVRRGNRPYTSRFVRNRQPIPCSRLVVIWQRVNQDFIRVITAYFTDRNDAGCPDEPGNILRKMAKGVKYTLSQIEEAYNFWSTHAFVELNTENNFQFKKINYAVWQ